MINTTLDDISAVVGFTATLAISERFGPGHLYIPQTAKENHELALLIGMPAMRALVKAWRLESLYIPRNTALERVSRNRAICEQLRAGATPRAVAAEHGLSRRRVEQLRARLVIVQVTG